MKITRRNFLKATGLAAACASLNLSLTACGGKKGFEIAVPNDPTNEARALMLLEANGIITLKEGVSITATKNDIAENPYNITIHEVEAAQLPNHLKSVDYAVINSNYAIAAGINPMEKALTMEGADSPYVNILVAKTGNENEPKIKALAAALSSKAVADYITDTYGGAVVYTVETPGDGYDASIDYAALSGVTVSCACSPAPHAEILEIASGILAAKDITLDIQEFDDYIVPNSVVDEGKVDTNYFQHQPYLDEFNASHGTKLSTVVGVHVEPLGIYGGKQTSLDALKK